MSPIMTGSVVNSVNLRTTHEDPNSPREIANTKLEETMIDGVRIGIFILINLLKYPA
jgi:hypothetical protein